jgi:hypothetical protein
MTEPWLWGDGAYVLWPAGAPLGDDVARPSFWYPDTCSENPGCILVVSNDMQTLLGIARTCTGHTQTRWGRHITSGILNPAATEPGDQGRYNAVLAQNQSGQKEP